MRDCTLFKINYLATQLKFTHVSLLDGAMKGREKANKPQPESLHDHEDTLEATTTSENSPSDSVAGKAEGPGARDEGGGGCVRRVEENTATGIGENMGEEVTAEGKKPCTVRLNGFLASYK